MDSTSQAPTPPAAVVVQEKPPSYFNNKHYLADDPYGHLIQASRCGGEEEIRTLLTSGASPNSDVRSPDEHGHTPLTAACSRGHQGIVRLLLDHGADTETKSQNHDPEVSMQRTPLVCAAGGGHCGVVRLLLDAGADVNGGEQNGRLTPLGVAVFRGDEGLVALLLEKGRGRGNGFDVDRKGTPEDRTVLSYAAEAGKETIVGHLLDAGADPDSRDLLGKTPLFWAAEQGHMETARILLDRGADPNAQDDWSKSYTSGSPGGRAPLAYAADEGHQDVAGLLVERGAKVDHCDKGGWSALSRAVFKRRVEVIRVLLEMGTADPTVGLILGHDPLLVLAKGRNKDPPYREEDPQIYQLLRRYAPEEPKGLWERFASIW